MALNKTTSINKVEFAGKWKTLQVRYLVEVKDGEEVIAQSYSRDSYQPNETLPEDLQPYADGVWTEELATDYEAWLESLNPPAEEEPAE
jgi:hypothetical protein